MQNNLAIKSKAGLVRLILFSIVLLFFVFLTSTDADAATFRSKDVVKIKKGETINDDIYASASTIQIDGVVNGDVYAAAATIIVRGKINGRLSAAAGQISIKGDIEDSVLAGGGNIDVDGSIGGDMIAGSGTVVISEDAEIGRDLIIGSTNADIAGDVGRDLKGAAAKMLIDGNIDRDAKVEVDDLKIGSSASIGRNLTYKSENKARISSQAEIGGKIKHKKVEPSKRRVSRASTIAMTFFLSLLWYLVLGSILFVLFERFKENVRDVLNKKLWPSLGIGTIMLIVTPVASIIILLTIIGIPVALTVFSLYIFGLYVSKIYVSYSFGDFIIIKFRAYQAHWFWSLLLGLVIILLLSLIPYFGFLVRLAVNLFGLGAISIVLYDMYKKSKKAKTSKS